MTKQDYIAAILALLLERDDDVLLAFILRLLQKTA